MTFRICLKLGPLAVSLALVACSGGEDPSPDAGFADTGSAPVDTGVVVGCGGATCAVDATCQNETCVCNDGFAGDGTTCSDIDECENAPCDAFATCANAVGSFSCACNDGFSGDGITCDDVAPPSVWLVMPAGRAFTEADDITVYGEAADNQGVASVTVNGTNAQSTDGFATWSVTVPVATEGVDLAVVATDLASQTASVSTSIGRPPPGAAPTSSGLVVDEAKGLLYTANRRSIVEIDYVNQSGRLIGSFNTPVQGIALDTSRNRLLVANAGAGISQIDLETTLVTPLSNAVIPDSNNPIAYTRGIAASADGTAIVARTDDGLVSVDPATGAWTLIPNHANAQAEDLQLTADGTTAYYIDEAGGAGAYMIRSVDVATGASTDVSAVEGYVSAMALVDGLVYALVSRKGLVVYDGAERVIFTDRSIEAQTLAFDFTGSSSALYASSGENGAYGAVKYDVSSGELTWVYSDMLPGDAWIASAQIETLSNPIDGVNVYFLDASPLALGTLEIATGAQMLLDIAVPEALDFPEHPIVADPTRDRYLIVGCGGDTGNLYALDSALTALEPISPHADGLPLLCPGADSSVLLGDSLIVYNRDDAFVRVNVETGAREALVTSSAAIDLQSVWDLAVDEANGIVLARGREAVTNEDVVVVVDPSTGAVTELLRGPGLGSNFHPDGTGAIYILNRDANAFERLVYEGRTADSIGDVFGGNSRPTDALKLDVEESFSYRGVLYIVESSGRIVAMKPDTHESLIAITCHSFRCDPDD